MPSETVHIVKEAAPPAGVAVATLSGGVLTALQYLPVFLGCVATLAGAVLSVALTYKAWNDIKSSKRLEKAAIEDIQFRQDNDLPCRRCTDKK